MSIWYITKDICPPEGAVVVTSPVLEGEAVWRTSQSARMYLGGKEWTESRYVDWWKAASDADIMNLKLSSFSPSAWRHLHPHEIPEGEFEDPSYSGVQLIAQSP